MRKWERSIRLGKMIVETNVHIMIVQILATTNHILRSQVNNHLRLRKSSYQSLIYYLLRLVTDSAHIGGILRQHIQLSIKSG